MNNWFILVLSKNPKKNPPNATIGPVSLPSPLFAAHTHCPVPIHSYDPARPGPCPWGRHPATPSPTHAESIARPSQGRPLVLLPFRRSWGCSRFCSPYVHARREREREKRRAGYDDGRAARPSLLLSNKAKKKKKKKLRALELWRARDTGLRLLWTSSILSAHVLKICYCIRARAWSFCKFPKPFLCLRKKKTFEEESSVGCRKKCSSLEAAVDNKLQRKLVRDVPIQKSFRVPQKN
jgi:hypothetical protein